MNTVYLFDIIYTTYHIILYIFYEIFYFTVNSATGSFISWQCPQTYPIQLLYLITFNYIFDII